MKTQNLFRKFVLLVSFGLGTLTAHADQPSDDGPLMCALFDLGNMPVIPQPPNNGRLFDEYMYVNAVRWNSNDESNQLILMPDYADNSLVERAVPDTPAEVGWRPEDRLIYGVNHHIPSALAELGRPVAAQYANETSRATEEARRLWPDDRPSEQSHRYIVLTYPTIASAFSAEALLHGQPGISNVNVSIRAQWAVFNPYEDVRLTPLFAFHSPGREDYFYTTSSYTGTMALAGTLPPTADPDAPESRYHTVGKGILGYNQFPNSEGGSVGTTPGAQVWLFATRTNPRDLTDSLAPLYRLSWQCGDPGYSPPCETNPHHTDFVYTADPNGLRVLGSWGYTLDCIEGFIYPKTLPQPPGTVRLMRKYNPEHDDHAIFPESLLDYMTGQGYTYNSGSDWLGYVYPNLDSNPPDWNMVTRP